MNKKSKLLLTSLATIAMSATLAVGGTYALFTDKADVNIAISSGTVDVNATVENAKVYSGVWNSASGAYESIEQRNLTFLNDIDGTPSVEFTANSLTIEKMTPMDKDWQEKRERAAKEAETEEAPEEVQEVAEVPADAEPKVQDDIERQMIIDALAECKYIKTKTADYLGITVDTLNKRIKKYNIIIDKKK